MSTDDMTQQQELLWRQELTLAITPKCTAPISIVSNCFILYECYCDRKKGKSNAIQRALVGMSCIDILSSFAWFLSTWAIPSDFGSALASGNRATCNFQGFLLQLAIGAPLYNCSLAMYYLLVIKYNWSNDMLHKIERWTHAAILSFSIGSSILLLPLTQYNPIGTVCWVMGSPPRCGSSSYQASSVECERGDHAYLYGLALFYAPLWGCILACITSMVVIYFEVRRTHRRMRRYSVNGSTKRRHQVHSMRRSASDQASVAMQAVLYSLSFFVTWTPSTAWSIAHWFNLNSFALDFLSAFCEPLQGFWNALIFLRKRPGSQEKLRVFVNTILPCLCKEPGLERDTENSGHCNNSRHRGWTHGNHVSSSRAQSSGRIHSDAHPPDAGGGPGGDADDDPPSEGTLPHPMDVTSDRSTARQPPHQATLGGSVDQFPGMPPSDAVQPGSDERQPAPSPAVLSSRRPSAILRMFAPAPSRARRHSRVSFAEPSDGSDELRIGHDDKGSDNGNFQRSADAEPASRPGPSHQDVGPTHEGGSSDTTQPIHDDRCSEDSRDNMVGAVDPLDLAQQKMLDDSSHRVEHVVELAPKGTEVDV